MEQNKIVFEASVTGAKAVEQSLAGIKKELKEAQSAALNGDGKAAKRVAELRDKIDDLKDATKSLQGSGIERSASGFSLLGEGLRNLDFDKVKVGLGAIKSALAATGIMLIVQGVMYLIENFDELSKGSGLLAKSLRFVGDVLETVKTGLYAVTDALGITNSELDKAGEAIKGYADSSKESLSQQNAEFDRQIRVAKAAGRSTVELEIAKQKAIIDTNVAIARQIEAFVRAGGEFDDEKRKLLTASLNAIKDAKVTELEIEVNHTAKVNAEYKKRSDEKKKLQEESSKMFDDVLAQEIAKQDAADELERNRRDKELQDRVKHLEDLKALQLKADQEAVAAQIEIWEQEKKAAQEKEEFQNTLRVEGFKGAQNLAIATQSISDIAFSMRMAKVKKGSAEETALMKKQFEANKKMQIAQTTISGITSAIEAYKSLAGIPIVGPVLGGIAALAAGASALAAVQKIRSTQFEGGGGGSVDTGAAPSLGSVSSPQNTQAPTTRAQPFTQLDEQGNVTGGSGKQETIRAYVVEKEITDSQKRVNRLENQASFG